MYVTYICEEAFHNGYFSVYFIGNQSRSKYVEINFLVI